MSRRLLIILDKTAFRLLFGLVVVLSRVITRSGDGNAIRPGADARFLLIRPGGLGDAIMTVPVLRSLRSHYPESRISVMCVKKNRAGFELLHFHDELIQIGDVRSLKYLVGRRFDVVFDLEPFRRISAVVAWLTGAKVRVGFDTGPRRRLYTHLVNYSNERLPESANLARQLESIGIRVSQAQYSDLCVQISKEDDKEAMDILRSETGRGPLVAIAPGVLKPQHRWSNAKWAEVATGLLETDEHLRVVLLGSPGDRQDAEEVCSHLDESSRVIDLVGKIRLTVSMAVLKHCQVLLACDGGILYMAAAVSCPSLSLWGPGVMERFKPPGAHHIGIRKDFPCIPCVTWNRLGEFPPCPYDRKCYKDLSAAEVLAAFSQMMADINSKPGTESVLTSSE